MGSTFNQALLAVGIFQTTIIALLLWRKRASSSSALAFITLIIAYTAQVVLEGLDKSKFDPASVWSVTILSTAIPLALCPLSLLYVKYSLPPARVSKVDPVYFLPFLYYITVVILFNATHDKYIKTLLPEVTTDLLVQSTVFIFFLLMSIRSIVKDRTFTKASKIWLEEFTFAVHVTNGTLIASFKSMLFLYPDYQEIRYLFFALPILIYWLTYRELINKKPSPYNPELRRTSNAEEIHTDSNLPNHYANEVHQKLVNLMEVDKAFTEPGLNLDAVSSRLNIPRHHIAQVLHERAQKTFTDFINEYRIGLATQMVLDPKYNHLTMAAIGFDCGFNSISTFNLAFKKIRHSTPAAYKKKQEAILKRAKVEEKTG